MTYVLSDIHGNMRRFHSILRQIDLKSEDTLYILGDVIDRHPHGIKILREIMAMPNAKMLLGNHEYMMLRAIGEPYDGPEDIRGREPDELLRLWYRNGGDATHHFWKHTRLVVRAEILDYLKSLPLNIDVVVDGTPYKLVHAAALDRYEECYITMDNPMCIWREGQRIGIDCGAGWPDEQKISWMMPTNGRLACLRLEDMKEFYSEEPGLELI